MTDAKPDQKPAPDFGQIFADMARSINEAAAKIAFTLAGQGAMGHCLTGDEDTARRLLAKLTNEQLAQVGKAALRLSAAAFEFHTDATTGPGKLTIADLVTELAEYPPNSVVRVPSSSGFMAPACTVTRGGEACAVDIE